MPDQFLPLPGKQGFSSNNRQLVLKVNFVLIQIWGGKKSEFPMCFAVKKILLVSDSALCCAMYSVLKQYHVNSQIKPSKTEKPKLNNVIISSVTFC